MIDFLKKIHEKLQAILVSYSFTLLLTLDKVVVVSGLSSFLKVFHTDVLVSSVLFFSIFYFISKNRFQSLLKRESRIVKVFSVLLSFVFVVGSDITYTQSTFRGNLNLYSILLFFILLLMHYIVFNYFLTLLWVKYKEYPGSKFIPQQAQSKLDKKKFSLMLIPFLLVRFIGYLILYPGVTTYDSMVMIAEGFGIYPLTNSHPYLFTYIVGLFTKFGWKYLGGVGAGVAIFNFLTFVITSLIFTYVLYKIFELSSNWILNVGLYLFYLLYPNFVIISFTMYKDVYLVNALLLFTLCIIYSFYSPKIFFSSKVFFFTFLLSFLGIYMMHRKAVIYIVVGIIVLLIFNKKYYKKIILYSVISLIFTLLVNSVASSIIQPMETRKRYDFLASRFQQIAAAVYYHPDSFTKEELKLYDDTLGLDNNKKFLYFQADPIKDNMKNEQFEGRETEFFKLWLKGYLTHPKTYIDAILNLSVSYWYPYNFSDLTYMGNYYRVMYEEKNNVYGSSKSYDKGWSNETKFGKSEQLYWELHKSISYLPVFSIFYSAGLYTVLLLIMSMISILKKDYSILGLIIICITIILTCIYFPVANYFRYSYVYMAVIPLLIPLLFIKKKD